MKLSEMNVETVADYLHEDPEAALIPLVLEAAKQYILSYTGLDVEKADTHTDLCIAALALCGEMYENRIMSVSGTVSENPVAAQILGAYSVNLLP